VSGPFRLQPGKDTDEFVELTLKPGSWERNGIPGQGCRLRRQALEELLDNGGGYGADDLILGLMDWLDVTDDPMPAAATLRQMLGRHYPPDGRGHATCHFVDEHGFRRRFGVGLVDLSSALVAWQRDGLVFAVGQASSHEPGRMVIAAPLPLPLKAARLILALAAETDMKAPFDSFDGAVTVSGRTANFYAWEAGELATCHWPEGLGMRQREGTLVDCRHELHPLPPDDWIAPNQVAMMIAVAAGYVSS
jgi:hypothetical protein